MDDTWFQILVVIMSSLLIIILVVVIYILVKLAKVTGSIKKITTKAESLVDRADHISSFFEKTATPVALIKLFSNISDSFTKKGRKK